MGSGGVGRIKVGRQEGNGKSLDLPLRFAGNLKLLQKIKSMSEENKRKQKCYSFVK